MQRMADPKRCSNGSLPCSYFHRSQNCLHNQVLTAGLRLGGQIAQTEFLRTDCHRMASLIGKNVDEILLTSDIFKRMQRKSSRLTAAYDPALRIIGLLMQGSGIMLKKTAPTPALPGFLFDMNRFFQALLSRFLSENLKGFRIRGEQRIRGMMSYLPGYNPRNKRPPCSRPDFIVERNTDAVAVLDAKYRDLWEHTLPRDMLYQLSVYALSQVGRGQATILYPTTISTAREARISISEPLRGVEKGKVILRPVHLNSLHDMILAGDSVNLRRRRAQCAMSMVFGEEYIN